MSTKHPKLKLYFIAGEASGDLHGSNLMKALRTEDPEIDFRFWGGDLMQEVAGKPVKHIQELAFMGFTEVLMNLGTILTNIKNCKEDILTYQPDALVLIDYPGFNLRIAEWAKKQGIKVYYYISPQVWAWKQSRVHKIKATVDQMFVILPFETAFYAKFDFPVEYVGHPLLDAIGSYREHTFSPETFRSQWKLGDKPVIAVLPGSRKQEVRVKLPIMLDALAGLEDKYEIIVAGAPSLDPAFYAPMLEGRKVHLIQGATYDILSTAEAAVVTSGTATLETALLNVPEVVCYKASSISYHIAKRLIRIKFISLVNLIMDREVVRELIQHECNPQQIRKELGLVLAGGENRERMLKDYAALREILGGGGASQKVAQSLLKTIH
jgi:lipid-A-disaccharide synthase